MDLSPSVVFAIIAMSMVASCLVFAVIQEATVRLRGTNRVRGLPGFIGINIIVLGAGAASLQWLPQWSGLVVVGTFIALVAPGPLQLTAEALVFRGDHKAAAVAARSAYLLWPSAKRRFNAAVCAASADGSIEQKVEALRTLAPRATPQQQMLLESWVASLQDDWKPFLDRLDTIDGGWPSQLHFVVIYALGELGRGDEMAQAFSWSKMHLSTRDLIFCHLVLLAFGGRSDGVRLLFQQQRHLLPASDYLIAIAAKASGTDADEWRRMLATFAATTNNESFRRAAERHLAEPRNARGPRLSWE